MIEPEMLGLAMFDIYEKALTEDKGRTEKILSTVDGLKIDEAKVLLKACVWAIGNYGTVHCGDSMNPLFYMDKRGGGVGNAGSDRK